MGSMYSNKYKQFLRKLKEARKKSGYTQTQVSKILGYPQSFVSKCESGERRVDIIELLKFAKIYNQPLEFFIKKEDE